jgi:hypothetical protein
MILRRLSLIDALENVPTSSTRDLLLESARMATHSDFSASSTRSTVYSVFNSYLCDRIRSKVDSVDFLTRSNMSNLRQKAYMVTPKAHGYRKILLCEEPTGRTLLLQPWKNEGEVLVQTNKECKAGFALEVEEVILASGDRHLLAFNVLHLSSGLERCFQARNMSDLTKTMEYLVSRLLLPNLSVKHYWPASSAQKVWEIAKKLPYPVDGLVFTPYNTSGLKARGSLKWKPLEELTIDVALGEAVEINNGENFFIPHLFSLSHLRSNPPPGGNTHSDWMNHVFREGWSAKKAHVPFTFNRKADVHPCSWQLDIAVQRHMTVPPWPTFTAEDSGEEKIGEVSTGEEDEDKKPAARSVELQSEESGNQHGKQMKLFVQSIDSKWVANKVVEAAFDPTQGSLIYRRMRRDKARPNSVEIAETIVELFNKPLNLSDHSFHKGRDDTNEFDEEGRKVVSLSPVYGAPIKGELSLVNLRRLRIVIKGFLYKAFGGHTIVDACCGGLCDMKNWHHAGCKRVLALEKDPDLIGEGANLIRKKNGKGKISVSVDLVQTDLSTYGRQPLDDETWKKYGFSADAIFCNFALHYFWGTCKETSIFLGNLVPLLRDDGNFVAVIMKPDALEDEKHLRIYNDTGTILEFSAKQNMEPNKIDVFVASSGKTYEQHRIESDAMIARFASKGLHHVATLPFENLAPMHPADFECLTPGELEILSLYCAVIFKKAPSNQEIEVGSTTVGRPETLHDLPEALMLDIYAFLEIPCMLKLREISTTFWKEINEIPKKHAQWLSGQTKPVLLYDEDYGDPRFGPFFNSRHEGRHSSSKVDLKTFPMATFLRFGGVFQSVLDVDPDYREPSDDYYSDGWNDHDGYESNDSSYDCSCTGWGYDS